MSEYAEITKKTLDQLYHSMHIMGSYDEVSLAKRLLKLGEDALRSLNFPASLHFVLYEYCNERMVDGYRSIAEKFVAGKLSREEAINDFAELVEKYRKGINELGIKLTD